MQKAGRFLDQQKTNEADAGLAVLRPFEIHHGGAETVFACCNPTVSLSFYAIFDL